MSHYIILYSDGCICILWETAKNKNIDGLTNDSNIEENKAQHIYNETYRKRENDFRILLKNSFVIKGRNGWMFYFVTFLIWFFFQIINYDFSLSGSYRNCLFQKKEKSKRELFFEFSIHSFLINVHYIFFIKGIYI